MKTNSLIFSASCLIIFGMSVQEGLPLIVQTGNSEASLDQQVINCTIMLEHNSLVNIIFHLDIFKLPNLVRKTPGSY